MKCLKKYTVEQRVGQKCKNQKFEKEPKKIGNKIHMIIKITYSMDRFDGRLVNGRITELQNKSEEITK